MNYKNIKVKNILVVTYWSYKDALIQTYTLPYIRIIKKIIGEDKKIYLVTAEQERIKISDEEKRRIKTDLKNEGIILIDFKFFKFGVLAIMERFYQMIVLFFIIHLKKISHIHAWCTPAGVTGYILSKLTFKPFILDSFEPHAEPSVENGSWKSDSFAFNFLFYFEKKQARHAVALIGTSTFMKHYVKEKYNLTINNFYLKPALIDLNKFSFIHKKNPALLKKYDLENKIICVYAGKIGGIYLEHETFDLLKQAWLKWGDKFRMVFLSDATKEEVSQRAIKAGIPPEVFLTMYVQHADVPLYLGLGDFAINPVKVVHSKICCTSIKDGEYWALGLPVIITNSLGDDTTIIRNNGLGYVLKNLTDIEYANAINHIDNTLKNNTLKSCYDSIRPLAERFRNFEIAEKIYIDIYKKKIS